MGKKLDKKAKAAVAKAAKGVKAAKVDKAVKKFRKLEGKLWTREYLLKIAEFDGATIAPANGAAARADAMGTLAGEHHKLLAEGGCTRGGRGLDQAHLRGRCRVAQGQDGQ